MTDKDRKSRTEVTVYKHSLLAGIGPESNPDVWICIQDKEDWRTFPYDPKAKKCPICGEVI